MDAKGISTKDTRERAVFLVKHPERIGRIDMQTGVKRFLEKGVYFSYYPTIRFITTIDSDDDTFFTMELELYHDQSIYEYIFPGITIYNQLLSIVEDVSEVSIEEFSHGLFHYLDATCKDSVV